MRTCVMSYLITRVLLYVHFNGVPIYRGTSGVQSYRSAVLSIPILCLCKQMSCMRAPLHVIYKSTYPEMESSRGWLTQAS